MKKDGNNHSNTYLDTKGNLLLKLHLADVSYATTFQPDLSIVPSVLNCLSSDIYSFFQDLMKPPNRLSVSAGHYSCAKPLYEPQWQLDGFGKGDTFPQGC